MEAELAGFFQIAVGEAAHYSKVDLIVYIP